MHFTKNQLTTEKLIFAENTNSVILITNVSDKKLLIVYGMLAFADRPTTESDIFRVRLYSQCLNKKFT